MSERTDQIDAGVFVAIDVVMEALGVGRAMAYRLAAEDKWRRGGGGFLFGDVVATHARRKAEQGSKRSRAPRVPRSAATRHADGQCEDA